MFPFFLFITLYLSPISDSSHRDDREIHLCITNFRFYHVHRSDALSARRFLEVLRLSGTSPILIPFTSCFFDVFCARRSPNARHSSEFRKRNSGLHVVLRRRWARMRVCANARVISLDTKSKCI
jgi:hypothetical protein